jgi:hypothetical protein
MEVWYMGNQRNLFPAVAVTVCVALCLISAFFSLYFSTTDAQGYVSAFAAGNTDSGVFQLKVLDGVTKEPIAKASVVLPQTGKTYLTDAQGQTEEIRVPIFKDNLYNGLKKQDWGNVCVLVYVDGYVPYALFDMQVESNKKRTGPTILMFSEGSTQSDDPFNIVEAPNRAWVNALVEKYKPEDTP